MYDTKIYAEGRTDKVKIEKLLFAWRTIIIAMKLVHEDLIVNYKICKTKNARII